MGKWCSNSGRVVLKQRADGAWVPIFAVGFRLIIKSVSDTLKYFLYSWQRDKTLLVIKTSAFLILSGIEREFLF